MLLIFRQISNVPKIISYNFYQQIQSKWQARLSVTVAKVISITKKLSMVANNVKNFIVSDHLININKLAQE